MATPARKTSKTRRNRRRTVHKITAPAIHYDTQTGEYVMSHHVSPNGFYNGKQIIKEAN